MCNRKKSICCLLVMNIIVLIICLGAIGFTIWAHCASKFEDLKGTAGFTDKIDITAVYYVCYIVFGVIGGTALIGIIACCCCQKCCMTLYAILLIIYDELETLMLCCLY